MNYQNAQGIVTTTLQNHRGLVSAVLRGVLNAVYRFIRFISYPVIRLLRLCLGILLMCNPLAMLGFGATGPIAGAFQRI